MPKDEQDLLNKLEDNSTNSTNSSSSCEKDKLKRDSSLVLPDNKSIDKELTDLGLNSQEAMFVYYYCDPSVNFVGRTAALRAMGIHSNATKNDKTNASKLAKNMLQTYEVRKAIDILRKKRLEKMEDIATDALKEIHLMATTNPTEMLSDITSVMSLEEIPKELHSCIKNIKKNMVLNLDEGKYEFAGYTLTFYDKQKSQELLTKLLGMQQVIHKHDVSDRFADILESIENEDIIDVTEATEATEATDTKAASDDSHNSTEAGE